MMTPTSKAEPWCNVHGQQAQDVRVFKLYSTLRNLIVPEIAGDRTDGFTSSYKVAAACTCQLLRIRVSLNERVNRALSVQNRLALIIEPSCLPMKVAMQKDYPTRRSHMTATYGA